MAGENTDQWVEIWGSVKYNDRPENHKVVPMNGKDVLIHQIVVTSAATGNDIYVSFFDESFPGFEHPGDATPIYIKGVRRQGGDPKYTNVTAKAYKPFDVIKAKRRDQEAF